MNNKKALVFPLLYMAFIFVLSSIPDNGDGVGRYLFSANVIMQNALHIPLFGVLALLWAAALRKNGYSLKKITKYALIITLLYAVFDEIHQYFTPGRFASVTDFFLDSLGCFAGLALYRKFIALKEESS